MTHTSASQTEHSVIERASQLANSRADNQHGAYIAALLAPWFIQADPGLREALRNSFIQGQEAQRAVGAVLAGLQPIEQFAEPLLKAALAGRGWGQVNPRAYGIKHVRLLSNLTLFFARQQVKLVDTLIRLTLPDILHPESLELDLVASTTDHSLLQAALQNFEVSETRSDGFDPGSCIYEVVGRRQVEHATLKPQHFALICRDLNLGMQYQRHLADVFEPVDGNLAPENVNSRVSKLNRLFSRNIRCEVLSALHMAHMKREVMTAHYVFVLNLLSAPGNRLAGMLPGHSTLQIMGFEVPGVMVFWPEQQPVQQVQACVLYLPNSPDRAFHAFESFEMLKATLREWLKGQVFARYFFELVPLRHRAEFMRRTDMKHVTWDSLLLRRPPIINEPALMSESVHLPQTEDPCVVAWRLQLAKIKDDARLLVVPTEDEDSKTRLERQATFLNTGLSLLTLALGFVPVLGEILLVTSVIQLGVDVYEGIKAWQRNDRVAALEHLFDIAQNVALAAGSAGAASTLRPLPVVDALVPVRTVTGQLRLWRPDLEPYVFKDVSLTGVVPDAQGLHSVGGRQFIQLEGRVFRVMPVAGARRGFIQHPKDAGAYTPRLEHNGCGAWVHELETPMQWSRAQLFSRLGPEVKGVSQATAELILKVTNTGEGLLRKLYMDHLPPPAMLADSIKRVRLSEMIESFIEQMKQGINRSVDNASLQLQLLTRLPGWPADRVLRLVDREGVVLEEYGPDRVETHPRLQIAESQVRNGDLLKVTLECLSSRQVDRLLGQPVRGLEAQVQALSRMLGELAQVSKAELLSRLYSGGEVVPRLAHRLRRQFPGLPVPVLEELISHLSPEELDALGSGERLQLHVLEEARHYAQVVRLNRSIEGLYFEALRNADSNSLALLALADFPGWPAYLRLVIRDKRTGEVLHSVGNATATKTREFLKGDGEYEVSGTVERRAYRSADLLNCVAYTLTPAERSVLGLPVVDAGAVLGRKIADAAARNRARSAQLMGMQPIKPWFRSPLRLADGRVGYTLGGRSGRLLEEQSPRQLKDLARELFPTMSEAQVGQFLYRLRLSPQLAAQALNQLKAQLQTLRNDLDHWVGSTVWSQPTAGPRVQVSAQVKRGISQTLIRTWRKLGESVHLEGHSGYVLDLNAWPVDCLPDLSADFSHVSSLRLHNSPNGQFPDRFLEQFPHLRIVSLVNSQLAELPAALSSMPELLELNLRGNQIVLNESAATQLSGLTRLKSLDLVGNPLGRRISVQRMVDLEQLKLRYTGLQTWPEGVLSLRRLQTLDLRDNNISRIPPEVLTAGRAAVNRVTFLHDNPLSADSLRRLENYRREHGITFGIRPRRQHVEPVHGIFHWAPEPTAEQLGVWSDLRGMGRSTDFFRVLEDLSASSQYLRGRENLTTRVWSMLDGMHGNSELREQLFDVSANPNTCADGIPMIFADLELRHQIMTAQGAANAEEKLLRLSYGLFRIELLDTHVQGVIESRIAQVHTDQRNYVQQLQRLVDAAGTVELDQPLADMTPQEQQGIAYRLATPQAMQLAQRLSPVDLQLRLERIEPLEVQMFYQVRLAEELGLPARPRSMIFERLANVTPEELEAAKYYVLSEDTLAKRIAFIEKQAFWEAFLEKKYPAVFQSADSPLHERMQSLYVGRESMSSQDYVEQTGEVGESRRQAREVIISRLTREEIAEHPFMQV